MNIPMDLCWIEIKGLIYVVSYQHREDILYCFGPRSSDKSHLEVRIA